MSHIKPFSQFMNEKRNDLRAEITDQIGKLQVVIRTEDADGAPGDTVVRTVEAGELCTISGESRDQFLQEINDVINKYKI